MARTVELLAKRVRVMVLARLLGFLSVCLCLVDSRSRALRMLPNHDNDDRAR